MWPHRQISLLWPHEVEPWFHSCCKDSQLDNLAIWLVQIKLFKMPFYHPPSLTDQRLNLSKKNPEEEETIRGQLICKCTARATRTPTILTISVVPISTSKQVPGPWTGVGTVLERVISLFNEIPRNTLHN